MTFQYRDDMGRLLAISPDRDFTDQPVVALWSHGEYGVSVPVRIPLDRVEELVAGIRDTARQATGQPAADKDTCIKYADLTASIGYPVRCPHCGPNTAAVPPTHWTKHVQRHHPDAEAPAVGGQDATQPATEAGTTPEQVEDLLRIAHNTSNKSEAERARAVQRAERAERDRDSTREANRKAVQYWFDAATERLERAERAEATIERVRDYATHLFNNGNTRLAQHGLHVLALIANQPEHTLIDDRGELRAALDERPARLPDVTASLSELTAANVQLFEALDKHVTAVKRYAEQTPEQCAAQTHAMTPDHCIRPARHPGPHTDAYAMHWEAEA
jgi:hypothetical protein